MSRGNLLEAPFYAPLNLVDCPFKLKFNLCAASRKDEFMKPFTLTHNHSLGSQTVMKLDGKEVIKFEGDLTDAEASAIEAFSISCFFVPMLETVLGRIFPDTDMFFHKSLLTRVPCSDQNS